MSLKTCPLSEIKTSLHTAHAELTAWGERLVHVGRNTYSLDTIAREVFATASQRCLKDNLTLAERLDGVEISKSLEQLYRSTDAELKYAPNCLTQALGKIRSYGSLRERVLEKDIEALFLAYSSEAFKAAFPGEKGAGYLLRPPRTVATESQVRHTYKFSLDESIGNGAASQPVQTALFALLSQE